MKRKEINFEQIFEQCVYSVLILSAVFLILASAVEPWMYHDVPGGLTIFLAVFLAFFLFYVTPYIWKLPETCIRFGIWAGILSAFLLQLYIVFHMQLVPRVDLSHIYDQCVEMLETGNTQLTDVKYFSFNTNNIPIAIVLYWVFRFFRGLGLENYRLAGGIFHVVLLFFIYVAAYLILKRIADIQTVAAVMFILLLNPAFYAYASYYYTDTVSLFFTITGACLMLYVLELHPERQLISFILSILSGFLIGLAVQIRVTSIFLVIASAICAMVKGYWRKLAAHGAPFLGGFLLFMMLWSRLYAYHVDFDTSDSGITVEHFLMMGSRGRGTYSAEDVKFTRSFRTHEERAANNWRVYKQRICRNGFLGNLRLAFTKEAIVWGIGSRGYSQYTRYVVDKNACYHWITGEKSACFRAYMQAYNIILFFVILRGLLITRKKSRMDMLILSVYWGGALVFYLFWEAHARHSVSFLPFLTMLAVPGIKGTDRLPSGRAKRKCGLPYCYHSLKK